MSLPSGYSEVPVSTKDGFLVAVLQRDAGTNLPISQQKQFPDLLGTGTVMSKRPCALPTITYYVITPIGRSSSLQDLKMALRLGMCTAMTEEVLAKLETAGIISAVDFVSRDLESLSRELHIPYKDLCSIRWVSLAEHSAYPMIGLTLYQNALSSLAILSSGLDSLDQLLDGGLYTGEVTELAGDTGTGKTRICHWCAVSTVKEESNSVLYIDICNSFDVRLLMDSMPEVQPDPEILQSRLSRIKCLQVFDVFQLFSALDRVMDSLSQQDHTSSEWEGLKLVIIENLPLLIYPIMSNNAPYNQGILSRLGLKLKQLADSFSIAVLVSNYLVSLYGHSKTDQRKPALGRVWSTVPHTRVTLSRKLSSYAVFPAPSEVEAQLVKSGRQQTPCSATISLCKGGSSS
ncbi:DNA repair protein RAD51 4 [Elysia marginata]|uniref:DNA repair protein RAD51 4 n=1 Tax=Elysia marginata TaxID=1093978 RepID=A0AAV4H230_9GAST|nr:DNA repair protein RAD51 4 [Elysia marginata]